jgi:hypothetical protein
LPLTRVVVSGSVATVSETSRVTDAMPSLTCTSNV